MGTTMRSWGVRILALAFCAAALYGGARVPVLEARESLQQDTFLAQLRVLFREVGVSVAAGLFPIEASGASREYHLRWTSQGSPPAGPFSTADPSGGLRVVTSRGMAGPALRLRSLRLSEDRLFIAAVDVRSRLRSWTIVADPRLIRAESIGPDGAIEGQTLYRPVADMFVTFPDSAETATLRVYQPVWDGRAYHLTPLGSVPVR